MRRMLKPLLCGLSLCLAGRASAATLSWQRGDRAESCMSEQEFRREVEQRLAGPQLSAIQPHRHLLVRIDHQASAWVMRLEVQDESGNLQGERTLSVTAASCKKISQYAITVVALALEGELGETPEPVPSVASPTPEPPAAAFGPEPAPKPPAPEAAAPYPRIAGSGQTTIYVYPPVFPSAFAGTGSLRIALQGLQPALAARALELGPFSVIQLAQSFANEPALQSWLRAAPELVPVAAGKAAANTPALPPADYVIVPLIEAFAIQNGIDYSLGKDPHAVIVSARITLVGFDFRSHRELPQVSFSTSLAFTGNAQNEGDARFAMRAALQTLAAEAIEPLRGYLRAPGQAEPEPPSAWAIGSYLYAGTRLAFREPSAPDIERAQATRLRVRDFEPAAEVGLGVRFVYGAAKQTGWRPAFDFRWTLVDTGNLTDIMDAQADLGRAFAIWPSAGIALVPQIGIGMLFVRDELGSPQASHAHLRSFLGAAAHLGLALEFHRLFSKITAFVALDTEYVVPLSTGTSSTEFLDAELPRMHAVGLHLGFNQCACRAD